MFTKLLPCAVLVAALALAAQPYADSAAAAAPLAPPGHQRTFARHGDRPGTLTEPAGIAITRSRVAVADSGADRIAVFDLRGRHIADVHGFRAPHDVAWTASGDIAVADTKNNRVRIVSPAGDTRVTFGDAGLDDGDFLLPMGIAVAADDSILVADHANDRVQVFGPHGRWRASIGGLRRPRGVATGPDRIVVAVAAGISIHHGDGRPIRRVELGWDPGAVAVDGFGRIIATDPAAGRVVVLAGDGAHLTAFGRFGPGSGDFAGVPGGVGLTRGGTVHTTDSAGVVHVWRFHRCADRMATHVGTADSDRIDGTRSRDVIVALGGDDDVRGRGGNDVICLGEGQDTARGGSGVDRIRGGPGADLLRGGEGIDEIHGGGADDRIWGGDRDDVLFGGFGADVLHGGRGLDACAGGPGADVVRTCEGEVAAGG